MAKNLLKNPPRNLLKEGKRKPRNLLARKEIEPEIRPLDTSLKAKFRTFIKSGDVGRQSFPPLEVAKQIIFPSQDRFEKEDANAKKVTLFLSNYSNTRLFGLPDLIANKVGGIGRPQPETPGEAISAGAGSLAGFIGGPIKVSQKITPKIPIIRPLIFSPAKSRTQAVVKTILRGAGVLGVAEALMTPEEGLFRLKDRVKSFGSGALTGAVFGALSFVPSKPLRISMASGFTGIPSAMREDPLEIQVFNFGLGAYFGRKGERARNIVVREKAMADLISNGHTGKDFDIIASSNQAKLDKLSSDLKGVSQQPKSIEGILDNNLRPHYRINRSNGKFMIGIPSVEKEFRRDMETSVFNKAQILKAKPSSVFFEGDVEFLLNNIKTKKQLIKLTDQQLYNYEGVLVDAQRQRITPYRDIFKIGTLPVKRQVANGKKINFWDATFRPGLQLLQKLGFGEKFEGKLTQQFMDADVNDAKFRVQHNEITNNWKRMIGMKTETSKKLFNFLNGDIHKKLMTSKEISIAKQMRQYLDWQLDIMNQRRIRQGKPPVKRLDNYITHLMEQMVDDFRVEKHPLPEYIESNLKFIIPKGKESPFLKKRTGAKGFREDIWSALDTYSFRTSAMISDRPVELANRAIRFTQREIRLNQKVGKESPVDWAGIERNLRSYVDDYVGRPTNFDNMVRNSFDVVNRHLPPNAQVRSLLDLTSTFNSLVYGTTMGFRPKLAIRNLGQTSLTFGEVGLKPLSKSIKLLTSRSPEQVAKNKKILSNSKVLDSRKLHFLPEMQPNFSNKMKSKLSRSAFWLYRTADRINVEIAFMSGYQEAKAQGKPDGAAARRGDQVAAKTQYLYLKSNRSPIARGAPGGTRLSPGLGRAAGVFTTWPSNWLELQMAWAKDGNRAAMTRYWGLVLGSLALSAASQINFFKATGAGSPQSLVKSSTGGLPIVRILENPLRSLKPQILNDLDKALGEDGDFKELFLYTWGK